MARSTNPSLSVQSRDGSQVPDRWFPKHWGAALWFSTGVGFLTLAYAVAHGMTVTWDSTVTARQVSIRSSPLTGVAEVLGWCGLAGVVTVWAGAVALALDRYYRTSWRCVLRVFVVLAIDVATVYVVKSLVDRPRPPTGIRLVAVQTPSFPSGHATATTAAVCMLLLCLFALPSSRRTRTWASTAGGLMILAMAWSRVYLGVHYLSDVIAGTLLGAWLALSTLWLFDFLAAGRRSDRPHVEPAST